MQRVARFPREIIFPVRPTFFNSKSGNKRQQKEELEEEEEAYFAVAATATPYAG